MADIDADFDFSSGDVSIALPDPIGLRLDGVRYTARCPKLDMWINWYRTIDDPEQRLYAGRDLVMAALAGDPGLPGLLARLADPNDTMDLPVILVIANRLADTWSSRMTEVWKSAGISVAQADKADDGTV